MYNACCAAHACGVRLVGEEVNQQPEQREVDARSQISVSEWLTRPKW